MNNKQNNFGYAPTTYYPYGELPLKYTKQGQEQLKRDIKEGHTNAFTKPVLSNNSEAKSKSDNENTKNTPNNFSGFNLNENVDFNTVLPLLNNLGGGKNDLIGKLIPLINGGGNLKINDLIKIFTSLNKTKTASATTDVFSSTSEIDNYKKVD